MKVLVVGKHNFIGWTEQVYSAFQDMNIQSELFLFNRKTPLYCLGKILGKKRRVQLLTEQLRRRICKMQPDLIFFVSFAFIPKAFYDLLSEFPFIKAAAWAGDKFPENYASMAANLDALFCTDTGFLKQAKSFPCPSYYLPLCCDEKAASFTNEQRTVPPFFVGIANPLRIKYLKACETPCLIYGGGWDKKDLPQHTVHNHKISHRKASALASKSIAPINMGFSSNNMNGLNFRPFEISAGGGLIVTNDVPDLRLCYKVGKEAVAYKTPQELNELLKQIHANPDKFIKIAKAGQKRTLQEHTYRARLEKILEILQL